MKYIDTKYPEGKRNARWEVVLVQFDLYDGPNRIDTVARMELSRTDEDRFLQEFEEMYCGE